MKIHNNTKGIEKKLDRIDKVHSEKLRKLKKKLKAGQGPVSFDGEVVG